MPRTLCSLRLEGMAREENGRITGGITFDIELKFNNQTEQSLNPGTADGWYRF